MRPLLLASVMAAMSLSAQAADITFMQRLDASDITYTDNSQRPFYYDVYALLNPSGAPISVSVTMDAGVGDENLSPWLGWVSAPPATTDWYAVVPRLAYIGSESTPGAALNTTITMGAHAAQWIVVSSHYYIPQSVHHQGDFALTLSGVTLPQVSGVPEPETDALMLAGLGLMGLAARRRT